MRPRSAFRLYAAAVSLTVAALSLAACDVIFPHYSEGEKLYRDNCAECHGVDGSGNTALYMGNGYADLLDNNWKNGGDPGSLANSIRNGVFGEMPGFGQKLTDAQIRLITEYIRVLRGEMPRERH